MTAGLALQQIGHSPGVAHHQVRSCIHVRSSIMLSGRYFLAPVAVDAATSHVAMRVVVIGRPAPARPGCCG
jgi:hypothetical protein